MERKPRLDKSISVKDFKDFYWYKEELVDFCRTESLDKRGGKIELANRIEKYLQTGEKEEYKKETPGTSQFDWNSEKLSAETIITDNYKNTANVRTFFKGQIGDKFKFNVKFMNWMKCSPGKTLGNAVEKWIEIAEEKRNNKYPKEIAPQFEYNTYIRDFIKDNPTLDRKEAIECWKIKKTLRGNNIYVRSDLEFLENND